MFRLISSGLDWIASYMAAPDMPHPAMAPHRPQNSAESHHPPPGAGGFGSAALSPKRREEEALPPAFFLAGGGRVEEETTRDRDRTIMAEQVGVDVVVADDAGRDLSADEAACRVDEGESRSRRPPIPIIVAAFIDGGLLCVE